MTISIIDDDQVVREATGDLVQPLGYKVATFESAERFLEFHRVLYVLFLFGHGPPMFTRCNPSTVKTRKE